MQMNKKTQNQFITDCSIEVQKIAAEYELEGKEFVESITLFATHIIKTTFNKYLDEKARGVFLNAVMKEVNRND